ncbi:MAG TPA: DsrE family protein [Candidatus Saccharimonadia bacterium]|nr:DsrE family protein [Candidatus Saccharimonadia bacterium]
MTDYFLIESRDPFECADVHANGELAIALAQAGHRVRYFLVQNAVLAARAAARSNGLATIVRAGIPVLADETSLRERGIQPAGLLAGVSPVPLELVVDALAAGSRVLWH